MPGETFHISLTEDARPFCARTVPFAYREKLKDEIDLLVKQGIIAPVTEPTEWCAPIVVTPKKNSDKIRICVDLSKLNKYVRRERYPSVTPAEDLAQAKAKFFTVFITSALSMMKANDSPRSSHPSVASNSCGHPMGSPQSANITIDAWMRRFQNCQFCQTEVSFAGFTLTPEGYNQ